MSAEPLVLWPGTEITVRGLKLDEPTDDGLKCFLKLRIVRHPHRLNAGDQILADKLTGPGDQVGRAARIAAGEHREEARNRAEIRDVGESTRTFVIVQPPLSKSQRFAGSPLGKRGRLAAVVSLTPAPAPTPAPTLTPALTPTPAPADNPTHLMTATVWPWSRRHHTGAIVLIARVVSPLDSLR